MKTQNVIIIAGIVVVVGIIIWWSCRPEKPVVVPVITPQPPGGIGVSPATPTNNPAGGSPILPYANNPGAATIIGPRQAPVSTPAPATTNPGTVINSPSGSMLEQLSLS